MKILLSGLAVYLTITVIAYAYTPITPPEIRYMKEQTAQTVASDELTDQEKIAAIVQYLDVAAGMFWGNQYRQLEHLFQQLDRVNRKLAQKEILDRFRRTETTRFLKFHMGRYFVGSMPDDTNETLIDPPDFIREYRDYIINEVIHHGIEEFCRANPRDTVTAVGEYASILAHTRPGCSQAFHDKETIPILIECLSAPDHVFTQQDGRTNPPNIGRTPGESTGRNVQRAIIPLALLNLEAIEAIEALETITKDHHDKEFVENAKRALEGLKKLKLNDQQ